MRAEYGIGFVVLAVGLGANAEEKVVEMALIVVTASRT